MGRVVTGRVFLTTYVHFDFVPRKNLVRGAGHVISDFPYLFLCSCHVFSIRFVFFSTPTHRGTYFFLERNPLYFMYIFYRRVGKAKNINLLIWFPTINSASHSLPHPSYPLYSYFYLKGAVLPKFVIIKISCSRDMKSVTVQS